MDECKPLDLGERSAGLALYFDTIMHFMILMFLLLVAGGGAPRGARRHHFSSSATCQLPHATCQLCMGPGVQASCASCAWGWVYPTQGTLITTVTTQSWWGRQMEMARSAVWSRSLSQ